MKKLIPMVIALAFALVAPGAANAQVVTKADVEAFSPQLVNLFGTMSSTFSSLQRQKDVQNTLITNDVLLLGAMSARLSSPLTPTNSDLQDMANQLTSMNAQVSSIVTWRANVKAAALSIGAIIGQIGNVIASAV